MYRAEQSVGSKVDAFWRLASFFRRKRLTALAPDAKTGYRYQWDCVAIFNPLYIAGFIFSARGEGANGGTETVWLPEILAEV